MGRLGFEPRTNRLKAECSTAELATLDLNTLPSIAGSTPEKQLIFF